MNNLIGKEFIDIKSGNRISVSDQFEDVIILGDGNRVSYSRLMDKLYYDEVIDPASFLKNSDAFMSLADKIKKMPDDVINESVNNDIDSPAIVYVDPQDEYNEMLEKARKMSETMGITPNNNVDNIVESIVDKKQFPNNDISPNNIMNQNQQNPIEILFSQAKKDTKLTINISFDINIPKKEFINMMEDTYDYSIINYLSTFYTDKILHDDKTIHNEISRSIKEFVSKKKVVNKKSTTTTKKETVVGKKPTRSKTNNNVNE